MKNKLFHLLIGSILSGVLLVGCNNNDDNRNVPITDNKIQNPGTDNKIRDNIQNPTNNNLRNNIQNPADNNLRDDNNNGLGDNNNIDDDDVNDNDRFRNTNDTNTDTDKDPIKDRNTKQEEIIEDDLDTNDRNHRDR
ncbi:hypothetical protein M3226_29080 [Neobacillus cucumis]|uniref:hypothetical protein n=1 Tax=Neobacillus cucumis TaxID=1740721 RepID=UPI0020423CD0|nr:hypothetical protein [Neobacillus cucumis]MCM3729632.1 hypothetical protein [Neobacillus cucumis]